MKEKELSVLLRNTIRELPVIPEDIKKQLRKNSLSKWWNMDGWLTEKDQEYHLIQSASKYYYMQIVVMSYSQQEKILRISSRTFMHDKN